MHDPANPGAPVPSAMVSFRARFLIEGYDTREDREAMREQDAAARRRRAAEAD